MAPRRSIDGWLVGLFLVLCLAASGCGKAKPKPPPPPVAATAHFLCDSGQTQDPPHQEARPAIQALRSNDYATAARLFEVLLGKYPESASLRVWLGDARLGQRSDASTQAALKAYNEAVALDSRGCKLRERETFFLAIGLADVQLRQKQPEQALSKLEAAAQKWPDNAEVKYRRARAECALAQRDACFEDLKAALAMARSRKHARFSRSHRASERLAARAAAEPDFEPLRKEARFRALLVEATSGDAGAGESEPASP